MFQVPWCKCSRSLRCAQRQVLTSESGEPRGRKGRAPILTMLLSRQSRDVGSPRGSLSKQPLNARKVSVSTSHREMQVKATLSSTLHPPGGPEVPGARCAIGRGSSGTMSWKAVWWYLVRPSTALLGVLVCHRKRVPMFTKKSTYGDLHSSSSCDKPCAQSLSAVRPAVKDTPGTAPRGGGMGLSDGERKKHDVKGHIFDCLSREFYKVQE